MCESSLIIGSSQHARSAQLHRNSTDLLARKNFRNSFYESTRQTDRTVFMTVGFASVGSSTNVASSFFNFHKLSH